jgi:hypothetical protein
VPDPHTLAALRTLVSAWTPPPRRAGTGVATGIHALDEALAGGLPPGRLTELVSAPGHGGQTVLARLLASVRAARRRVALIDATDAFAPEALAPDDLRHVVWARARNLAEALAVADILVRDGNFAVVVLDLRDVPRRELQRTPASSWHRLHRLAERQPAAVLVQTSHPAVPAVPWRLTLPAPAPWSRRPPPRGEFADQLGLEVARGPIGAGELAG